MKKTKRITKTACSFVLSALTLLGTFAISTAPTTTYASVPDDDIVTSNTVVTKPSYTIDDSEDLDENGKSNMAFAFENGASIMLESYDEDGNSQGGLLNGQYLMRFTLKETAPAHENLLEWTNTKGVTIVKDGKKYLSQDYFEYTFTVYRDKDQTTAVPMTEFYVALAYDGTVDNPTLYRIVARRDFTYYDEIISPQGFLYETERSPVWEYIYEDYGVIYDFSSSSQFLKLNSEDKMKKWMDAKDVVSTFETAHKDYTVLSYCELDEGGLLPGIANDNGIFNTKRENAPQGDILIETKNPNTSYFVTFNYKYKVFTGYKTTWFVTEPQYGTREQDQGRCQSPSRSYYDVIKKMSEIEDELEMQSERTSNPEKLLEQANFVLTDGVQKQITIEYLENIDGTPFGKKTSKTVTVPIYNGTLRLTDAYKALNVGNLDCFGSNCYTFEYNETKDVYTAVYLEHVYLSMETADGQQRAYFLDINKSFNEFYNTLVNQGIISEERLGFLLDGYYTAYPQLDEIEPGEFYGLFGFTSLPDTVTLDKLFSDIFGLSEDIKDVDAVHDFRENLTKDNYNKLLETYDYGYLDEIWQEVWAQANGGKHMATHYAFYCTGESRFAKIDEVEGDGGAIESTIPEIPNKFKNILKDLWQPIENKIMFIAVAIAIVSMTTTIIVVKKKNK